MGVCVSLLGSGSIGSGHCLVCSDYALCGQAEAGAEEEPLWQCPVRLVTFIGVGRDPHTFGLIADLGCQSFQCAAFWCQPHAGGLSEVVQAACMVSWGWNGNGKRVFLPLCTVE